MAAQGDIVQRLREAVVAALDTQGGITAITGRSRGNLVPWSSRGTAPRPVVAYQVIDCTQVSGVGDEWRAIIQFSAFAMPDKESDANALITQVVALFVYTTLAGLASPVQAYIENRQRRSVAEDGSVARADLDITLVVTNP